MGNNIDRVKWIDLIRALAIIFVVLCHSTEAISGTDNGILDVANISLLSMKLKIFVFTCFSLGRLGVPLFLMISGSLLLSKDYREEEVKRFWKCRCLHLMLCTIVWFAIYDLFLVGYHHVSIKPLRFFEEMIFLRKVDMSHVWYLPMILGFYISIPFVSTTLKKYEDSIFLFPLIVYTIYSFGFRTLNTIITVCHTEHQLWNQFSMGYSGGYYGLYIVYGYFVTRGMFKRINSCIVGLLTVGAFGSVVSIQLWSYQHGVAFNVWYDDLFLLIASVGLFEYISRMRKINGYTLIRIVSKYAFAIYLIHNIVKAVIMNRIYKMNFAVPMQILLLESVCVVISLIVSVVISRIPLIGNFILYMKPQKRER